MHFTARLLASGVRVRFAPSPTGKLHLSGLRTALFNFKIKNFDENTIETRNFVTDKDSLEKYGRLLSFKQATPDYLMNATVDHVPAKLPHAGEDMSTPENEIKEELESFRKEFRESLQKFRNFAKSYATEMERAEIAKEERDRVSFFSLRRRQPKCSIF
uniref:Glutamyl/glutaminyl-tRNA synthetase class Ib catalytic domain-containing protein n=1 Tax=Panagrolaimus davidi TaxID=227884 RepID=A0A914PMB3_9BILA